MQQQTQKVLARILRSRLEGRVPSHVLDQLSDDELCEQYRRHHESKLQLTREAAKKRDAVIQ